MNDALQDTNATQFGTPPRIEPESDNLEPIDGTEFAINTPRQALAVAYRLAEDANKQIRNQAAITAQLNGQRPRDPAVLQELGRNWLPNINSGILRVEAGKVPARLWQPINTSTYLTAAKLPDNWPLGVRKTGIFRQKVSSAIRSWRKWPWFMRQLAREVGFFGFGYAVHFDEFNWKPTFIRQDRGFVPQGFEILEDELPLFMVKWDYQPFELLRYVKEQEEAGLEKGGWNKKKVAEAINAAGPKPRDGTSQNRRSYEEMVREASLGWAYEKGYNKISTYHLFSTDADGTVSHHIVLAQDLSNFGSAKSADQSTPDENLGYIFEKRDQFKRMSEVVTVMMFDPDDGTIHGSWGAGQMLYDLALETEKAINDWMSSLKQAAKLKVQAGSGVTPDQVRLDVDDAMMVVSNGVYAGNTAAVTTDPKPFQALIESLGQLAREKIGSYIPPIPLQPTDIKAAQINAKQAEQEEVKQQIFLTWLWQFGAMIENVVKRLLKKDTDDETGKELREELLRYMNEKEIEMLVDQNQIETIFEFTEIARARRATFCASKQGNPFYNQKVLEEIQSEAAGGAEFASAVLIPGDDATVEGEQRRKQQEEATTMLVLNKPVAVLPADLDWYHMLELRPLLEEQLNAGAFEIAFLMLNHYTAHYVGGIAKQAIPKEKINVEKAFIAKAKKTLDTGQLPMDGFQDKVDLIDQAQSQMGAQSPATLGPTERTIRPESDAMAAGAEAMFEEL